MGKFVLYKKKTGFNFALFASNGIKLITSSELYTTKAAAKAALESVAKNSKKCIDENRVADMTLSEPTESKFPKFELYNDKSGLMRFRLVAPNGENIAICEEGYKTKSGLLNGIKSVAENSQDAEIVDETGD